MKIAKESKYEIGETLYCLQPPSDYLEDNIPPVIMIKSFQIEKIGIDGDGTIFYFPPEMTGYSGIAESENTTNDINNAIETLLKRISGYLRDKYIADIMLKNVSKDIRSNADTANDTIKKIPE